MGIENALCCSDHFSLSLTFQDLASSTRGGIVSRASKMVRKVGGGGPEK